MFPALSICIPTYNFGSFLVQALESITPQLCPQIEVVILDGGSTDNTRDLVSPFLRSHPSIRYYHQDHRGGIDRDIDKVVSLAGGRYCWLFSSDDIMAPEAIAVLLESFKLKHDIYLCEHLNCKGDMQLSRQYRVFTNLPKGIVFDLSQPQERYLYFESAHSSEAFFSFLAGPIFRRDLWDTNPPPEDYYGKCWIVAGRLLPNMKRPIKIQYLKQNLLYKRTGNDSFSSNGMVRRYQISIEFFQYIGNSIFGERSMECYHLRRTLCNDVPIEFPMLAKLRAHWYPDLENAKKLEALVRMQYSDPSFFNNLKIFAFQWTPIWVLKLLFWIIFKLLKKQISPAYMS
jgi:abequosyltransferase